ncbi:hypothetical protein BpHYR1_037020 [Brachionus plicatilis]|uniref:Uncharacterized protein n=1 Tax=Brachionus plicatilis TaxID=10195 RepID=A0A3M7SM51_BRAPC|nr:hypothetical protein BpHYR1_037020 [Brachionus plicatilis]
MENENDEKNFLTNFFASEAPIASEATQSAVKKVLSKHKNPIACSECGKLMKNERGCHTCDFKATLVCSRMFKVKLDNGTFLNKVDSLAQHML